VHAPPPLPTAIAFRNAADGLLGTTRDIETTRDGGRTWRVVLRTPGGVSWIGYDPSGRPRAILRDGENLGGPRWRPEAPLEQLTPCPAAENRAVVSGDWVLCIGQGSAGSGEKAVYRLTARGPKRLAWASVDGRFHGLPSTGYAEGIAMTHHGFGILWESRGTLYVTRDGGVRWTGLPTVAEPEVDFGIGGAAAGRSVAWVILARGDVHRRLLRTDDAGRTWHALHRWG